jgi:biopolymer transport protein ExbD
MISFKYFEQEQQEKQGLEITPLIDMVFLLLIFFLLTSYYSKPQIPVTLPESEQGEWMEESGIMIVIQENGIIFLNNLPFTDSELLPELRHLILQSSKKEVSLQVDRNVVFNRVVAVMDTAKKAGAETFLFLVEKKKEEEE